MRSRPRYPKPDANQLQIKRDLEASGFLHVWCDVSSLPVKLAGVDVYVYGYSTRHGCVVVCPVEIKPYGEQLNNNEIEFHFTVKTLGVGVDIPLIAFSAEDILDWFGYEREDADKN